MAQPATPRPQAALARQSDKKEAARLRSILFDTDTALTLTPIQIILFSLGFVFSILVLHILAKIFPSTTSWQVLLSIVIVLVSLGVSSFLRRR